MNGFDEKLMRGLKDNMVGKAVYGHDSNGNCCEVTFERLVDEVARLQQRVTELERRLDERDNYKQEQEEYG